MTDPIAVRFGRRVAVERRRREWTTENLTAKSGVQRHTIYNLEHGKYGCQLDSAVRLAAALGISLDGLSGPCERCGDRPAAGMTCNSCGASGDEAQP